MTAITTRTTSSSATSTSVEFTHISSFLKTPGRCQTAAPGGNFVKSSKFAQGGAYPFRAGCTNKYAQRAATTQRVRRGRCRALPARRTTVFTKRCGKPVIAPRVDRVVHPYRNFFRFRRWRVQFCNCIPPGRCGHRPLQTLYGFALVRSDLQVRTAGRTEASAPTGAPFRTSAVKFAVLHRAGGASPAPTLRRNAAAAQ